MPRKTLGERPMTEAERQARAREKRAEMIAELDAVIAKQGEQLASFRTVLTKICDRTSERLRTKADLIEAVDSIGSISASALAKECD